MIKIITTTDKELYINHKHIALVIDNTDGTCNICLNINIDALTSFGGDPDQLPLKQSAEEVLKLIKESAFNE